MKRLYNCAICDNLDFEKVYQIGIFSTKMDVVICKNCGLACLNPRWEEKDYDKYYKSDYYSRHMKDARHQITDEYYFGQNGRHEIIFTDVEGYADANRPVLEIGAGNGENIIWFFKNGFSKVSCVEADPICCERIRKHFPDISVYNGAFGSFSGDGYHLVILSHVLEHFVNPRTGLELIRNLLYDDGYLYILVPNIYTSQNPCTGFCLPHTHYFSDKTLDLLLLKCGFEIVKYLKHEHDEIAVIAHKTKDTKTISIDDWEYLYQRTVLRKHLLTIHYAKQKMKRLIELILPEKCYSSIRSYL